MSTPFITSTNRKVIPLPYEELQMLISDASNNKIGLTFDPFRPLKLLPSKTDKFKLYEMLTNHLNLNGERVSHILTTINPDLTNQTYIIVERTQP